MTKLADLTNQKFGKLLVLHRTDNRIKPKGGFDVMWLCKCECGNVKAIRSICLRKGEAKSCGCTWKYNGKNSRRWAGYEEICSKYWSSIKKSAERRGIQFNITIEEAWEKFLQQDHKCALSAMNLIFAGSAYELEHGTQTASLDRIDSTKGYTVDNIQWLHKDVNLIKNHFSEEYLISLCQRILERYNACTNRD